MGPGNVFRENSFDPRCPFILNANKHTRYYHFSVEGPENVNILLLSSVVNTKLYLFRRGSPIPIRSNDNIFPGVTHSHISTSLGVGDYTLAATTSAELKEGPFYLILKRTAILAQD